MENLTKTLLEGFDSIELKETDMQEVKKAVIDTKPQDTQYLEFSYGIDEASREVTLCCSGTDKAFEEISGDYDDDDDFGDSFDEDRCEELDNVAIELIEKWAKDLAGKIPALADSVETETSYDWYSGMSVGGESGPYTYDGFTLFLSIDGD